MTRKERDPLFLGRYLPPKPFTVTPPHIISKDEISCPVSELGSSEILGMAPGRSDTTLGICFPVDIGLLQGGVRGG